jgi:hypothetical protein
MAVCWLKIHDTLRKVSGTSHQKRPAPPTRRPHQHTQKSTHTNHLSSPSSLPCSTIPLAAIRKSGGSGFIDRSTSDRKTFIRDGVSGDWENSSWPLKTKHKTVTSSCWPSEEKVSGLEWHCRIKTRGFIRY